MAAKKYVQATTFYLAGSGVIIGATNIVVTSFNDIYGNALTLADFGDKGYGTLEPDTTNEEAFTFTTVTTNANGTVTLGGVSTALAKSPYTETSGLIRAHSGGTKLVITDSAAFWSTFANKNNNETIAGKYTFPLANRPTMDSDADTATVTDLVTLGQLSRQAIAGASNASTTVKGIVQEATQAQVLAKTAAGSTGADLYVNPSTLASTLLSDYKVDTGAANAYVITPAPAITAYTVGQIFSFKAVNANTTASTLNVNGLGAKTIKNAAAADLVANDILAGQVVILEYDGTNFQMLSPSGNLTANNLKSATTTVNVSSATAPSSGQVLKATSSTAATWQTLPASLSTVSSGTASKDASDATTTQNIAHGLGATPKYVRIYAASPMTVVSNQLAVANTTYNGTTQSSLSYYCTGSSAFAIVATFTLNTANTASATQSGVVTYDGTNIIITWTKTGSPTGTYNLLWEAIA